MIESTKKNDTLCNQTFRSNYPLYAVICNSYLNCAKADGSPAALVAADKILDIMPLNEVRHMFDTILLLKRPIEIDLTMYCREIPTPTAVSLACSVEQEITTERRKCLRRHEETFHG